MNSAALRFIPKEDLEGEGFGLEYVEALREQSKMIGYKHHVHAGRG